MTEMIERGAVGVRVVAAAEMAEIDRRAHEEYAMPGLVLMERAGGELWRRLRLRIGSPQSATPPRVVVAVGGGNNGGDALVMARVAYQEGYRVTVLLVRRPQRTEAATQVAMCEALGVPMLEWAHGTSAARATVAASSWIVDGITGTGLTEGLRASYAPLVEALNASGARRCAVDIPSGLYQRFRPSEPAVRADLTLTVELPKLALMMPLARPYCGAIEVVPIGFPAPLLRRGEHASPPIELIGRTELSHLVPTLSPWSYKHQRGVVAVAGGSGAMLGAALLAADGAAAAGAGLVRMVVDGELVPSVRHLRSSYITEENSSWKWSGGITLIVGPGWGRERHRADYLREYIESGARGVLDADALPLYRALSAHNDGWVSLKGKWVLTPHPGEFMVLAALPKEEALSRAAELLPRMAADIGAVIVLKSHTTFIAAPSGALRIYDHPNPALATGGSGDTLAGVIGALLARGVAPFEAASAGVVVHGAAGQRCYEEHGLFRADSLAESVAKICGELVRFPSTT